jgi:hypothetical protein
MNMERIILLATLIFMFLPACMALDDSVSKKAAEYKAFDELIESVTEIEYKNRTYYMITYTKTLMPSGSILIDNSSEQVEDIETLKLFSQAEMIHKNYPPGSVGQWMQFSDYFNTMSGVFSKNNPNVSQDSRRISELLANSAVYLNGSIYYLSPEYTQKYIELDREAIDLMEEAYERTPADEKSTYLTEYRDSLKNIRRILSDNMDGIDNGGTYMAELMKERVLSEKNRQAADIYTIGAMISVLLFVFLVVKRGNKKHGN